MASFKTHIILGTGAGLLCAVPAAVWGYITLSGSVLAVFLGSVSSVLPDIDSDTGTPRKFILSALEILGTALLMLSLPREYSLEKLLLAGIAIFFLLRYFPGYVIEKSCRHRGAWHSVPMALITALTVYLLFHRSEFASRIFFAGLCFAAFILHLVLDEICALKYFGLSVKRSFGTAFKFSGSSRWQTVLMYLLIVFLAGICFLK